MFPLAKFPRLMVRASMALVSLVLAATPAVTRASAAGAAYYVNGSTGSDGNPGTQALPWKTIQKAANALTAGQVVYVAPGTYDERVGVKRSGVPGARIVYLAQGKVEMRGFNVRASYVRISGFEITNRFIDSNGWGIYLTGSYDIIEKNYIHDVAWGGILLFANTMSPAQTSHALVRSNTIAHVGQVGIDVRGRYNTVAFNDISGVMQYVPWITNPPVWADADGIHFHGKGHTLRGNKIHDILYAQPENVNPHIDCFQTFLSPPSQEAASSIVIDRNTCYEPTRSTTGDATAKFLQAYSAAGLKLTNNVVYSYLGGIVSRSRGISFLNNTFVVPEAALDGQGLQILNSTYVTIRNNVFSNQMNGNGAILIDAASAPSLAAGRNCLWRQGNHVTYPGDVAGHDPLFVNGSADFHLEAGSPCIDHGLAVSLRRDRDGHPRPEGSGYDIGAYEQ